MSKKKSIRISKYEIIAEATEYYASEVCNYVSGVSANSTSKKAEIIRFASDFFDKQLAAFKIKIVEDIKNEIEKIE